MWKLNRPGVRAPGRCYFLSLADRPALAVVTSCDEHETDHGEPGDHEGNSDHGVVLSVFRALPRRASAVQRALQNGARARWSSAPVMLRAMPACRAGDVTGCLADESGSPGRLRPCNIRVNSAAFYWLNYRGMKIGRGGGTCTPVEAGCRPAAIAARRHLDKKWRS